MNEPPTLFDSHLLLPFEFMPTKAQLARFWDNPTESGRFLRNALLYDRIYVPTVDLLVLVQLVTTIGAHNLIEALESRAISLVRYRGALAYIGNSNGLSLFELRSNQDGRIEKEEDRTWAPIDEVLNSLGAQFASGPDSVLADEWPTIARLVMDGTVEIDPREFDPVAEATYREVLGNPFVQAAFTLEQRTDLKRIPGIGPDQLR